VLELVQIRYSLPTDHLGVLRDKIRLLGVEIAEIQALNQQFRRDGEKRPDAQVAHGPSEAVFLRGRNYPVRHERGFFSQSTA
jgi:hypothetical protein